jgi:hypothetical protein
MRESLLEGEGMKALRVERSLPLRDTLPNGSSIKGKMMGGGKMPMYMYGGK